MGSAEIEQAAVEEKQDSFSAPKHCPNDTPPYMAPGPRIISRHISIYLYIYNETRMCVCVGLFARPITKILLI